MALHNSSGRNLIIVEAHVIGGNVALTNFKCNLAKEIIFKVKRVQLKYRILFIELITKTITRTNCVLSS